MKKLIKVSLIVFAIAISIANIHMLYNGTGDINLQNMFSANSASAESIGANCPEGYLVNMDEVVIVYWVTCGVSPQDCCKIQYQ